MPDDDAKRPDGLDIPEELRQPTHRPDKPANPDSGMWGMAKAWGVALDFIFTIIAGGALGWLFDKWQATAPTGIMVGLALGFVVAFIRIVRASIKQDREESRKRKKG